MRFLNNIRISIKLPITMFGLSALALAVMGLFGYFDARDTLQKEAFSRLEETVSLRTTELEQWVALGLDEVAFQAVNPNTINALRSFSGAWGAMEEDQTAYLQDVYITQNENPEDARDVLLYPSDKSSYSRNHKKYHAYFQAVAKRNGFADVYLIDRDGNVVYSVYKRSDFATLAGVHPDLQRAVENASETAIFLDFAEYAPGGDLPSGFFAAQMRNGGGDPMGTIVFRVHSNQILSILKRSVGLGSGSASRILRPDSTVVSGWGDATTGPAQANAGLDVEIQQQNGHAHAVAAAPLDMFGLDWIVTLQQPVSVLLMPATQLGRAMLLKGSIVLALLAGVGLLIARSMSRPLGDVGSAMARISQSGFEESVPHADRKDEIGDIAAQLETFRQSLQTADGAIQDSRIKSAALDASSAAIMILDENRKISHINQAMRDLFAKNSDSFPELNGQSADTLVGTSAQGFLALQNPIDQLENGTLTLPLTLPCNCGALNIIIHFNTIQRADGTDAGWILEWLDATEQQFHKAILKAIEANQVTLELAPDGTITTANPVFEALSGTPLDALIGKNWQDVVVDGDDTAHWSDALQKNEPAFGLMHISAKTGDYSAIEGGFFPIEDFEGKVVRLVFIGKDVTQARSSLAEAKTAQMRMQASQTQVVAELKSGLQSLSNGLLNLHIETPFDPEYDQLRQNFNAAVSQLNKAIGDVVKTGDLMRHESEEMVVASEDLAKRTDAQAKALLETAASLDQLTQSVQNAAEGTRRTTEIVAKARDDAAENEKMAEQANAAMSAILESSKEIGQIVSVIDDISFQTNLLALNAGVEAARAGSAGRGFAVVASEVRALAMRSAAAASQINGLIRESGTHVQAGAEVFQSTSLALKTIAGSINEISHHVDGIAATNTEQSSGLETINTTVAKLNDVTQQNAAMSDRTSIANQRILERAVALSTTLRKFDLTATSDNLSLSCEPLQDDADDELNTSNGRKYA